MWLCIRRYERDFLEGKRSCEFTKHDNKVEEKEIDHVDTIFLCAFHV